MCLRVYVLYPYNNNTARGQNTCHRGSQELARVSLDKWDFKCTDFETINILTLPTSFCSATNSLSVHIESLPEDAVDATERSLRERYPCLTVPSHSRLRHFEPQQFSQMLASWACNDTEKALFNICKHRGPPKEAPGTPRDEALPTTLQQKSDNQKFGEGGIGKGVFA